MYELNLNRIYFAAFVTR